MQVQSLRRVRSAGTHRAAPTRRARAKFGFGRELLDGALARFTFDFRTRFGGNSGATFGCSAGAQFSDLLVRCSGMCIGGEARFALGSQQGPADGNRLLGDSGACVSFGTGSGIDPGAVVEQCAGAGLGPAAVFCGNGGVCFGLDAPDDLANRLQVNAAARGQCLLPRTIPVAIVSI